MAYESEKKRAQAFDSNVSNVGKVIKGAATTAAGIGLYSKIAPFLSDLIPVDLAIKGISKFSPQLGNFLKKGQKMGLDIKEGIDYIKNNAPQQEEEQFSIRKNHPEIAQEIEGQLMRGMSPQQAAAIISNTGKHSKTAKDIQKKTGKNFEELVAMEFNEPVMADIEPQQQQQNPQAQGPQGKSDWSDLIAAIRNG